MIPPAKNLHTQDLMPLLLKVTNQEQLASTYIFTGGHPEVLKNQALLLAKKLNCDKEVICDECSHCKKINHGLHPDLYFLVIESTKIDDLRELQKKLHLKPHEAKFKIVIMDGAHLLGVPASNSILKILEEPPPHTLFLLLTPYLEQLLPTIISRSHIIRMRKNTWPLPKISFLNQLLELPTSIDELFQLAQLISKEDEIFHECLEIWLGWYRSILFHKENLPIPHDDFKPKDVLAKNISDRYSVEKILGKISAILETKKNLAFQVRRDLLAENLLIQLMAT